MTLASIRTLALFLAPLLCLASVALPAEQSATEREIMRLEREWNAAYIANDLPKYFGFYADEPILVFYNARTSLADYRKAWTLAVRTEPVEAAPESDFLIRVAPSGDVAIVSYQMDVRQKRIDGTIIAEHGFETDVWLKSEGRWRVAHVHYSTAAPK